MRPVAAASGLASFTVRNGAQGGGESYSPMQMCMTPAVGSDVDFINWEWQYFGAASADQELFVRNAALLPRRPAVYFVFLHCMSAHGSGIEDKAVRRRLELFWLAAMSDSDSVRIKRMPRAEEPDQAPQHPWPLGTIEGGLPTTRV